MYLYKLIRALFKSIVFMCIGGIIYSNFDVLENS